MYKKFFALPFLWLAFLQTNMAQSSDMQQMVREAQAIKNRTTAKGTGKARLPSGYDNSWKVTITLTRTMNGTGNITETSGGCPETRKSDVSFSIQSRLSSDQTIGSLNGDDFELTTAVDDNLKEFMHPLKGSYSVNSQAHGTTGACDRGSETAYSGNSRIDPSTVGFSFRYNKKRKQGNFMIALPENYEINASGEISSWSKGNAKTSADASEIAKSQIGLTFATCGLFQSQNYPVAKDANIQQALSGSPVNGGMASILETKFGYEISYSQSKTVKSDLPDRYAGTGQTTYNTSVHISINTGSPIEYDAIVESVAVSDISDSYDNWIPKGAALDQPENDRGNSIGFAVYLVDKKRPGQIVTGVDYDVSYALTDISNEPGYCLNYPFTEPGTEPDLKFDNRGNQKDVSYSAFKVSTLGNNGSHFIAVVTSYDYGSFAKMTITVSLKSGYSVVAHFKNDSKTIIPLPKDDNDNQIADAWEKGPQADIFSKNYSSGWDGEKQKLSGQVVNNHDGDGITLYEEYRGAVVEGNDGKRVYQRLDPNKKELFVLNRIGDKVKSGEDLFYRASGIKVVEMSDRDIDPNDLVINVNSEFAKGGRQHALLLKEFKNTNQGVLGETLNHEGTDKNPKCPRDCAYVGINSIGKFEGNEYTITVAHELAHGVGVSHHGSQHVLPNPYPASIDNTFRLYDGNMVLFSPVAYEDVRENGMSGDIAGPGSASSGNMNCIMCYSHNYAWAAPLGSKGKVYIHIDKRDGCDKTFFCNSRKGTLVNDLSHKPYPVYGDAEYGDCIHQFLVKDW